MLVIKKLEQQAKKRHGYLLILLLKCRWRIKINIENTIILHEKDLMKYIVTQESSFECFHIK